VNQLTDEFSYKVGSAKYNNFPLDSALYGCEDDNVSLDHRDPSHPIRNIIKRMFELREIYPVLNDGYYLEQLANQTYDIYLPGSNHTATETGIWSIYRSQWYGVQDLSGSGQGDQSIWMLYTNENETKTYNFNCNDKDTIIAPFDAGTTVKNLFAPYEEYTLEVGPVTLGLEGSSKPNGCLPTLTMFPYGFKALVPKSSWVGSNPVVTEFLPGHDYRLEAASASSTVHITLGFSAEMDCNSVADSLTFATTSTFSGSPSVEQLTINCTNVDFTQNYVGQPTTAWTFEADLINLSQGIHQITLTNVSDSNGNSTSTTDTFLLRVGTANNPMVFPRSSNFSSSLLYENDRGELYLSHQATGADSWRYSLNYGTSFSDWLPYSGGNTSITTQPWSGTDKQSWKGKHVKVQYWSQKSGSSDHFQSGNLNGPSAQPRRFPNLFMMGDFNDYGYDQGLANELHQDGKTGLWKANFMAEWPAAFALNAWGLNPDGKPDATMVLGDVDGDNILDRIPPISLLDNVINITGPPELPYLAYRLEVDDGSYRYTLVPIGTSTGQAALYFLLALIPVISAFSAVMIFVRSFYAIKFNEFGNATRRSVFKRQSQFHNFDEDAPKTMEIGLFGMKTGISVAISKGPPMTTGQSPPSRRRSRAISKAQSTKAGLTLKRRRVLIATMEYDIEDWGLKIKIGGLGVMAQLMGKNLEHQDLVWVVPCVGDIKYPEANLSEEMAEPMEVTILNELYTVKTRIHVLRNITYILLDAPIFRQQTKSEPYPPRMDDIESAVYYSAWNQCIAEAIRRFEPDLYHINDYRKYSRASAKCPVLL
jgi:alpha-1,3-glucan synthase